MNQLNKKSQFNTSTLKKLFAYMKNYKTSMIIVMISILLSSISSAASSLFIQTLIDDHIMPLLKTDTPIFSDLINSIIIISVICLTGVFATLIYNRVIVTIAQGVLKTIRDDIFNKMQCLPLKFFDTNNYGDIMSLYTNDTDTLRQMIAQSMAQLISSIFTIIAVLFCMLYISVWLTIIDIILSRFILQIIKKFLLKLINTLSCNKNLLHN